MRKIDISSEEEKESPKPCVSFSKVEEASSNLIHSHFIN